MTFTRRCFVIGLILAAVVPTATVHAQQAEPPSRSAALSRFATSCKRDVARFCAGSGQPKSPRDALICLRPYRTNVSLTCRSAIAAASR